MVVDFTDGIDATLVVVNTRVLAFLADTCEGAGAVRVNGALWFAFNVWISLESWWTGADTSVSRGSGYGILSTGIWVAGIKYIWL